MDLIFSFGNLIINATSPTFWPVNLRGVWFGAIIIVLFLINFFIWIVEI